MVTYFKSLSPATQAVLIATASALAGAGALWAWQYFTEDEKVVLFKKSLKEQQKNPTPAMDEKVLKELSDKVLAATADVVKMALKEAEQAAAAAKAAPAAAAPAAAVG